MDKVPAGNKSTNLLILFIAITLGVVFLSAYTRYIFAKDYTFYIEAACDPSKENCFVRDCNDYCPPNGLAIYSAYHIKASIFPTCINNDCANICQSKTNKECAPILCDIEAGDSCSELIK